MKPIISMIVAAASNNAIGKNNQMLWHLPNDMKFFKNTTWGSALIMGRKTFESVNKPFAGRINIVITKQPGWQQENVITAISVEEALRQAKTTNCNEIFIIGGGEIYRQMMPLAQRIYCTRVAATLDADTFFPAIDPQQFELSGQLDFKADEKHAYDYSFQTWNRKQ